MALEARLVAMLAAVLTWGTVTSASGSSAWVGVELLSLQMEEAERHQDAPSLPALAKQLGLNKLVQGVQTAGLTDTLSGAGPFTVFGPTDAAFAALPEWAKTVVRNVTVLTQVLEYHVLSGEVKAADIKDENQVTTLQGLPIRFNIYKNGVYTAQCSPIDLKHVDQAASNGLLHELTRVMMPPAGHVMEAVSACPTFKTLVTAVKAAGLVETLNGKGPFTVFAPTDKAFAKVPKPILDHLLKNQTALKEVLEYHVVPLTYCSPGLVAYDTVKTVNGEKLKISVAGGTVKINNSVRVIKGGADASVINGVIHGIDGVLLPAKFRQPL